MSIISKFKTVKKLLSEGQYGKIVSRVLDRTLSRSLNFWTKYYYLRREFRSFVANYEYVKMPTGGGA